VSQVSAIVITGAGSGLGRALALQYSKDFNEIILIGRNQERLQQTKDILQQSRELEVFTYTVNIQNHDEVKSLCTSLFTRHDAAALINNAGVGHFGPVTLLSAEEISEMLDTNVKGTIFLTQAFIKEFAKKGTGKILNIISTAGLRGKVNESVYATDIAIAGAYMGGMDTPFWDNNEHIKDKTRLKSPAVIAEKIYRLDDGRTEIIVE
jgi:short-subunit dehydrogenase